MFEKVEFYKPSIARTTEIELQAHSIALNRDRSKGCVTFRALPPSDVDYFTEFDLLHYSYEDDLAQYARDWLKALESSIRMRRSVNDNFIPNISPMLGIGDYSAFVAGDIYFARDTSWSKPVLENIEDFNSLPPIGSAPWYKKFLTVCELLLQGTNGMGIPFMRGFFSPLDLAAALRGEAIYYDFYDDPEALHRLLDYCADCTIQFARDIYSLADSYLGNTKYGMFYLDGINMSEDIACMIGADLYREFCSPHTQKVIDAFGKGYMHCHSRAMYLVKEICRLDRVVTLWLATDPNQPRPIENIKDITEAANCVSIKIDCSDFSELINNKEALSEGNYSVTLPVKDIKEAEELSERAGEIFGV
ncbi:MAG: uroporphyrinogen decarboxylase family protein [Eubacteriales bacterium]|nr:uroporphyrinogen decarboxylase family protein [Eubacteriales bacterium]